MKTHYQAQTGAGRMQIVSSSFYGQGGARSGAEERGSYGRPERWGGRGWWILPSVLMGLAMWVLIVRALLGWIA